MTNVVLGVSGSVAAYRAADLAREMMRQGWTVRVCLTDSAQKFVSPALFEALTGQPCLVNVFDEPVAGRMAHIDWAHQADLLVIAPATANTLVKIAHGIGEDMLTTIAIAFAGPIVVAPAMNPAMYLADGTREALSILSARAVTIVEPTEGDVACGESGQGKLASIEHIVEATRGLVNRGQKLKGKNVLITSGPTREPIDDVRFLSNRSSGKMGFALAKAALMMGAKVHMVTGPTSLSAPYGATADRVTTASEMLEAARSHAGEADIVIGAAAVSDYRPKEPVKGKLRRSGEEISLALVQNPDIIAELAKSTKGLVIGFAAEPDDSTETAANKLRRKGLSAIAVNNVAQEGIGFESDENELTLLFKDGREVMSGRQSKLGCAFWLFDEVFGSI